MVNLERFRMSERWRWLLLLACMGLPAAASANQAPANESLAPIALVATPDHKSLFLACAGVGQVKEFDTVKGEVVVRPKADDQHGKTSHLTKTQIDDLVAYLFSL